MWLLFPEKDDQETLSNPLTCHFEKSMLISGDFAYNMVK